MTDLPTDLLPATVESLDGTERVEVEVLVGGKRPTAGAPCEHRLGFTEQVTVGLRDDETDGQKVVHREALLKLRCRDCGVPMRFVHGSARVSLTAGDLGIVVDFEPAEDLDGADPYALPEITGA